MITHAAAAYTTRMEIRKATRDDWPDIQKIYTIVYNHPRADFEVTEGDQPDIDATWAVFENGRPVSVMSSYDFAMVHDRKYVSMAGIGGVGTLPESRRRGHVRRLFAAAFSEMRDTGRLFTTLFPFSFPYYRMFGYELVYSHNDFSLPLDAVDLTARVGGIELVTEATPEIRAVYESFATGRNLVMKRTPEIWKARMKPDPYKDQVFTYLYRDDAGSARAYFTFHAQPDGPHRVAAAVRDIAFDSDEALIDLLPHIAILQPRATRATLRVPSDVALDLLIPDPSAVGHTRSAAFMGRIVDLRAALRATHWPGAGELVLSVSDEHMDWNAGTFCVEWGDGECRVSESKKDAQLTSDVRVLTQLLSGYIDGGTALRYKLVTSELSAAELSAIFPAKPQFQNHGF